MEKQYQERCHNPDHENHSMAIFRIMLICKIEIITLIYVDRQYKQTKAPLTKNAEGFLRLMAGTRPCSAWLSDLTII